MRAIHFDRQLTLEQAYPQPIPPSGEALIRVRMAGICNTDIEITQGYMNFKGVLGHEFVGVVERSPDAPAWEGKRVVGEINAFCRTCDTCRRGDPTHCPHRTTLGIDRRDGAMADYVSLPTHLLYEVPEAISDEQAVFTEPLAAACAITNRLHLRPEDRVVVVGDGKLGLLVAQVLQLTGCQLQVLGRHWDKLEILARRGVAVTTDEDAVEPGVDVVVDCTGSTAGFATVCRLVRPRGTVVMKSTFHGNAEVNLSLLVVNEVTLHGSRCGPFQPALRLLAQKLVEVDPLISARYPLAEGLSAFEKSVAAGVLKVLLLGDEAE